MHSTNSRESSRSQPSIPAHGQMCHEGVETLWQDSKEHLPKKKQHPAPPALGVGLAAACPELKSNACVRSRALCCCKFEGRVPTMPANQPDMLVFLRTDCFRERLMNLVASWSRAPLPPCAYVVDKQMNRSISLSFLFLLLRRYGSIT